MGDFNMRILPLRTILLLLTALISGCGGSSPGEAPGDSSPDAPTAANPAPANPPATPTTNRANTPVVNQPLVVEKQGRKWIDDVPLDVWFNDPTAVANNQLATNTPAVPGNNPATTPVSGDPVPMPMANPGGGHDWKSIISADVVDKELTAIRNRLNGDLQTLGQYNGSLTGLPPHLATMAVMAGIATKHPDEIRWKKNARFIWALAGAMNAEKPRRGNQSYKPLQANFLNIVDTLSGSVPPGVEDPGDSLTFGDTAPMAALMKRLEIAERFLKVDGGSEDSMKENAEKLLQEAQVVAGISRVLTEGYGFEDDPAFEKFVGGMIQSTKEMRAGIEGEDFGKFELAISAMSAVCMDCHGDYR